MATPFKVKLDPSNQHSFSVPSLTQQTADKTSELLQHNHDKNHIFYNAEGFHNHVAHLLLTTYALGATPAQLQRHFDREVAQQRSIPALHEDVVKELADPAGFRKYLGKEDHYNDYMTFFAREMERKGWQSVISEYVFAHTERSDDLLGRLFMGFLHPLIHLGFGVEFGQPAIMAEALAQAAVHGDWMNVYFFRAEEQAEERKKRGERPKTLVALLDEIRGNDKLRLSPHWDDNNKIRDGILSRAQQEMLDVASQFWLEGSGDEELERKTAKMIDTVSYYTGGAQRPPKQVKFDFYFMHCVNCSVFYSAFLRQKWIKPEDKKRLVEWKARADLAMYASRRAPEILLEEIVGYKPKLPPKDDGEALKEVFERVVKTEDDGHAAKLVRAIAHGKSFTRKYQREEGFVLKEEAWDKLAHMAVDSVEDSGARWARSVGFDEAWTDFVDRPLAML